MPEPLIRVEHLKKGFPARDAQNRRIVRNAVDDVSFSIDRGETLGLVGESGCGKTTLSRTILRLIEPDSGRVVYQGKDLTALRSPRAFRQDMQIIFQNPAGSLDPRMRVMDIVGEGLAIHRIGADRAQREKMVLELLAQVGLTPEHAQRYPQEFSGGQQQRIGIARAMALQPSFIICDEAVSALDVSYQSQIINLLEDMQSQKGLTYLFISHDVSVVRHISDRIAVMYLGRFVELGSAEEICSHAVHPYTRALLRAVPVPDPALCRQRDHTPIPGDALAVSAPSEGCRFSGRCPYATPRCMR